MGHALVNHTNKTLTVHDWSGYHLCVYATTAHKLSAHWAQDNQGLDVYVPWSPTHVRESQQAHDGCLRSRLDTVWLGAY